MSLTYRNGPNVQYQKNGSQPHLDEVPNAVVRAWSSPPINLKGFLRVMTAYMRGKVTKL